MQRLKSRSKQVPNGFTYRMPAIRWDSRKVLGMHPSFDTLVSAVISARRANPHQATEQKWSLDRNVVADEVEAYNVKVCLSMGWTSYLAETGGTTYVPKASAPLQRSLGDVSAVAKKTKAIWSGVKTLNDWIDSGEPAVAQNEAERRAAICVACNLNGSGGLERFFTAPASEAIKRQFERLESRKLTTSQESKLGICEACFCPLRLKVFTPMPYIRANLSDAVVPELRKGNNCWILEAM